MAEGTPAPSRFKEGDVISGKYVLQRPLAKGGMGAVWVAQNTLTERKVAIKFMLPELATTPDTVQRFFREAKASARIDHPCIVDVLDLGTLEDGAPFLVMEMLEGRSLEQIVEQQPLTPIQIAALMLDVTHALAAAHSAGIVHRDLKPANIYVARKGESIVPKILDFGISKITSTIGGDVRMTRTGAVLGSPAYMSPEQARGRNDIDGRADIWAVGVILYEAVSGKLPFTGENYNQVMMAITLDPPTPLAQAAPSVDAEFVAIVDACLKKERDERPPTMDSLAALLDGYVAPRAAYGIPPIDIGDGGSQRHPSGKLGAYAIPRAATSRPLAATPRAVDPAQVTMGAVTGIDHGPKRARRNAFVAGIVGAVVLAAGAGGAYVALHKGPPTRPAASSPDPKPSVTATAVPSSAPSVSATTPEPASASATVPTPEPSVSAAPSASASAKPKPTTGPKIAPKPKASDGEGPANVGPGPGF
jgi:serine/threonine-protein kinase